MKLILGCTLLLLVTLCFGQSHEYISQDSLTIDGTLKLYTGKGSLMKFLGKAPLIKEVVPECDHEEEYGEGVKFFTYAKGGLIYLVYKDRAEFWELDLANNPKRFIQYKGHMISNSTTLSQLRVMFPKAYKEYIKQKSEVIRLRFGANYDDLLLLEIIKGRVSKVYYWTPC